MITNFKNLRVTVMGLGLHGGGVGAVEFLAKQGAKVLVTDLKDKQKLKESLKQLKKHKNIKFVLGQHRSEDFIKTDLVIKNPAVNPGSRYLEIAKKNKVPIETEMGLFFNLCPCPIIGITGSKGKSTTASLIYKLLATKRENVHLAGNIRISALSQLKKLTKKSLCVLELSSWQLDDIFEKKRSPAIAVVLNIIPDHLDRYKNFQDYIEAKKTIFRHQRKKDILILNHQDLITRSFSDQAKSQVIFFGTEIGKEKLSTNQRGAYIKKGAIYFGNEEKAIAKLKDVNLKGQHNIFNVLAAVTLTKLYKLPNQNIARVLEHFSGPEGRLQLVGKQKKVLFYNDTAATIPEATIAAIKSFDNKKKIVLISGGQDKGLDYAKLAEVIAQRVKSLILLSGTASDKIYYELQSVLGKGKKFSNLLVARNVKDMKEAILLALEKGAGGSVVLLSPGAASFNLFENEFDRGGQFEAVVKSLNFKLNGQPQKKKR